MEGVAAMIDDPSGDPLDDPLMVGFVRLKSLLMEAQAEFGEELGQHLVALAMQFKEEHGGTTAEAYYGLRDEARLMIREGKDGEPR